MFEASSSRLNGLPVPNDGRSSNAKNIADSKACWTTTAHMPHGVRGPFVAIYMIHHRIKRASNHVLMLFVSAQFNFFLGEMCSYISYMLVARGVETGTRRVGNRSTTRFNLSSAYERPDCGPMPKGFKGHCLRIASLFFVYINCLQSFSI